MICGKPGRGHLWIGLRWPSCRWYPAPTVTITCDTVVEYEGPGDEWINVCIPSSAIEHGGTVLTLTLPPGQQWHPELDHQVLADSIETSDKWVPARFPWITRLTRGWVWL